jgi:competence protein ComEA
MTRIVMVGLLALGLSTGMAAAHTAPSKKAPAVQNTSSAAPVNLNTATAAQLEALPGIGKSTAERILEYRQKNGGFKKAEDLMNVRGIGEKNFLKLKSLITVGSGKTPDAQ